MSPVWKAFREQVASCAVPEAQVLHLQCLLVDSAHAAHQRTTFRFLDGSHDLMFSCVAGESMWQVGVCMSWFKRQGEVVHGSTLVSVVTL